MRFNQAILLYIFLISFSSLSNATLFTRDLDGDFSNGHEAVYDDVLNITWLRDARIVTSNTFGLGYLPGVTQWHTANGVIDAMNTQSYLGVNNWRMPYVTPLNGTNLVAFLPGSNIFGATDGSLDFGFNISANVDPIYNPHGKSEGYTGNELAYHYYINFAGIAGCSGGGNSCDFYYPGESGLSNARDLNNLALFDNFPNPFGVTTSFFAGNDLGNSTSGTTNSSGAPGNSSTGRLVFDFKTGGQNLSPDGYAYLWAVTDGDVGTSLVPIPPAMYLLGTALLGLLGLKKKK